MPVSPKKELSIILPDLNRVIYKSDAASNQYSFPFTKMVVPSQTIQSRVYLIMRDCQHIMFCNRLGVSMFDTAVGGRFALRLWGQEFATGIQHMEQFAFNT